MGSQRPPNTDANDSTTAKRSSRKRYWPGSSGPPATTQPPGPVEKRFSHDEPLLRDHRIFSEQVLVGATYVSMGIEWATKRFGDARVTLRRVTFTKALMLREGQSATVGLTVDDKGGFYAATSHYRLSANDEDHVAAHFQIHLDPGPWSDEQIDPEQPFAGGSPQWDGDVFYRHPAQDSYGPSLRSVERVVKLGEDSVLGRIRLTDAMLSERQRYFLHPAILDACHVVSSFSLGDPVANHRVPLMIKKVEVAAALDAAALTPCYCRVRRIKVDAQLAEMDIVLYDSAGRRLLTMEGFTTKSVANRAAIFDTGSRAAPELDRAPPEPPAAGGRDHPRRPDLASAIQAYLRQKVATLLNKSAAEVSVARNFMELGLESQSMIATVARIEAELGVELYPTLFFEYQNIAALASHFKDEHGDKLAAFFEAAAVSGEEHHAAPAAAEVSRAPTRPRATREPADAIAIIGMGGYLPRSEDLRAFWRHLITGRDLVEEVPASRWDHRRWYDKDPKAVNKTYSKWGSFLEDVDKFDPQFFGVAPRVADWMDPQVRLLLQSAQQTFEDAGVINSIGGSRTDVYVGSCYHEYWEEIVRHHIPFADYQSQSVARSLLSATISYTYDLQGASIPLDNACASSLTALHLACRSIRQGECDQALVAGANLLLSPLKYVHFSRLGALSPTGRCHTFDRKADGYVPGEGVVSVLIKPLARAVADGDNIHAVIRATAINHVGRSNNPLAPRPELQIRMLQDAWARAGIDPRRLSYLEAHGTGTKLGDPIEIGALTKAFKAHTSDRQFCAIGSAKAHMGHLEAAAGLTSLIKVILMMKHQQIPRMPNFEQLNEYIDLKSSPFYVNTEVEEWRAEGGQPRLAGISAFGMSGNNAHVVLEEYIPDPLDERGATMQVVGRVHVVPLSAKSEEELLRYAAKLLAHIDAEPAGDLGNLAYTLQVGRQAFSHRAAFVARGQGELQEALRAFMSGRREGESWVAGIVSENQDPESQVNVVRRGHGGDERQIAERWAQGGPVDWEQWQGGARPRRISLPTYPFRKERYWMDAAPEMAAHPPPDIDLIPFLGKPAAREDARPPQDGGDWIEQELPVKESEWSAMIAARHGQRVLVVVRDEELFREVTRLFEGIDAIVSKRTFEVAWVPEAPGPDAATAYAKSLEAGGRAPHLVLYVAGDSPQGGGATAQWRALATAVEQLTGVGEIHVAAALAPAGAETRELAQAVDGLVSSARHRHTVVCVEETLPAGERAALLVNEWLWRSSRVALVDYRGGRRRSRASPRETSRPETPAPDLQPDAYGFLRKQWRPKAAPTAEAPAIGDCLVLVNEDSQHLLAAMRALGGFSGECVVASGDGDVACDARLPFGQPHLLEAAASRLLKQHPGITTVVDLADLFDRPRDRDGDKLGRFLLVQQLVKRLERLSLLHVTRGLQTHLCDAPSLAGAKIAGLYRMLGAEYTRVRSKSIDLDERSSSPRAAWRTIDEELRGDLEETEICYRDGARYVARVEEDAAPPTVGAGERAVEAGGAYVIAGGTSGVGLEIARYLAERGAGALMLIGQTPLPERSQWRALVSQPGTSAPMRARLTALLALEQSGVRLFLYTGGLADEAPLRGRLDAVRKECGGIRGVVHSAAAMQRMREAKAAFVEKRMDDIRETMAPKVDGLHTLATLLAGDPLQFFIVFSSVAARIPRLARGLSDYAAANAYLEHFVAYRNRRGDRHFRAIVWTGFRDAGSHARDAAPDKATGPSAVEHAVGQYGLRFNDNASGRWLFGRAMTRATEDGALWPTLLDRQALRERAPRLTFASEPVPRGTDADDGGPAFRRLMETLLRDGREAALPLLKTIDIERLHDAQVEELSRRLFDAQPEYAPTRGNSHESTAVNDDRALAGIKHTIKRELATVLRLEQEALSEHNSFQSHGLDSISGTQMAVAIERSVGIDISPAWLIEHSNIHALAHKIAAELSRRAA